MASDFINGEIMLSVKRKSHPLPIMFDCHHHQPGEKKKNQTANVEKSLVKWLRGYVRFSTRSGPICAGTWNVRPVLSLGIWRASQPAAQRSGSIALQPRSQPFLLPTSQFTSSLPTPPQALPLPRIAELEDCHLGRPDSVFLYRHKAIPINFAPPLLLSIRPFPQTPNQPPTRPTAALLLASSARHSQSWVTSLTTEAPTRKMPRSSTSTSTS